MALFARDPAKERAYMGLGDCRKKFESTYMSLDSLNFVLLRKFAGGGLTVGCSDVLGQ